jgi:hypothetical protein
MATLHRDDELAVLADLELVQHAYSVVPRIYALDELDDRGIADELYVVLRRARRAVRTGRRSRGTRSSSRV